MSVQYAASRVNLQDEFRPKFGPEILCAMLSKQFAKRIITTHNHVYLAFVNVMEGDIDACSWCLYADVKMSACILG